MRAVFVRDLGGTEALSLDCTPEPIPGPDHVVVDVQATAANFVDLLVIDGKYQFFPPLPFIPGRLPTGKIASIGSNTVRSDPMHGEGSILRRFFLELHNASAI